MTSQHVSFAIIATIWGLTWIAIKTGVDAVPPFFFAAMRLVTAGTMLLAMAPRVSVKAYGARIVAAAVLVNTVTYGLLFWGMQYVPSGLSSVLNLSLIPVGLFTIGLAAGEETYSRRKLAAIGLGVLGLTVLFLPKLSFEGDARALAGMAALVTGTLAYCWGSILSRPLLRSIPAQALSGWLSLVGGLGLALLSVLFEPIDAETLGRFTTPSVLASWAFLVVGGSIVAFTLYLRLLRDWGPTRAGLYAFVSPLIAVAIGVAAFGEPFGVHEVTGSIVMLGAAALAMR